MDFNELRQRASEAQTAKDAEETRIKTEEAKKIIVEETNSNRVRLDFQQQELARAVENLKKDKETFKNYLLQLDSFPERFQALEGKRWITERSLTEATLKLEEALQDPAIQQGLALYNKKIKTVEQFVADVDFAEEPGVKEVLAQKASLASLEKQITNLQSAEKALHQEVIQAVGKTELPEDTEQARVVLKGLLEEQLKQCDAELASLEPHTPEGEIKAETELKKLLEARSSSWGIPDIKTLASRSLNINLVSEQALAFEDVLGRERFTAIVAEAYEKQAQVYEQDYKKNSGLDKWQRDFKALDEYPKQLEAVNKTIGELTKKRDAISLKLTEFLLSDQGQPALLEIARKEQEKKLREEYSRSSYRTLGTKELKAKIATDLEQHLKYVKEKPEHYARFYADVIIHRTDFLATAFVADSSMGKEPGVVTKQILHDISRRMESASHNLWSKKYNQLPDLNAVQNALGQIEIFYGKLDSAVPSPGSGQVSEKETQALLDITNVSRAAYTYTFSRDVSGSYQGIRTALENPYTNNFWYEELGADKAGSVTKDFVALMPNYSVKNLNNIQLENPSLNQPQEPRAGYQTVEETMRDRLLIFEKFSAHLQIALKQKAELDVVNGELNKYGQSSKFPEVKNHLSIEKRQQVLKEILPEIIVIQHEIDEARKVNISEQRIAYGIKLIVADVEASDLKKRWLEINNLIDTKSAELVKFNPKARPGFFSGKQGEWDTQVKTLNKELASLRAEKLDNEEASKELIGKENSVNKLTSLLERIAKSLPDDYEKQDFAHSDTAGQIFTKLNNLIQEVSELKPTHDEAEFAGEYEFLNKQVEALKARFEKTVADFSLQVR